MDVIRLNTDIKRRKDIETSHQCTLIDSNSSKLTVQAGVQTAVLKGASTAAPANCFILRLS